MNNIILEKEELKTELREIFKVPGASFPLKVTGGSMSPFLAGNRDTAILSAPTGEYKKGDILLYQRENDRIILHRVIKTEGEELYFAGDSQDYREGPVSKDRVLALCTAVIRKGERIERSSLKWKSFSFLWIKLINKRKKILKLYSQIR